VEHRLRFTLLFEALIMALISAMPVAAAARLVGEQDTRLWRVLHHYVDQARARLDTAGVSRVAIDETAARRGHDYVTLFADTDEARVLYVTLRAKRGAAAHWRTGKDAATVAAFAEDLAHGGDPRAAAEVCIDMSPAFISGTAESLPAAAVAFDKFHAVKLISETVDKDLRAEQRDHALLKGMRYHRLRNPENLSDHQRAMLDPLPTHHLKTARACQMKLAFLELYEHLAPALATRWLKRWHFWATHSRLATMIEVAATVKRHWNGIHRWFDAKIANELIEGINSLVQAAKAQARSYRSVRY